MDKLGELNRANEELAVHLLEPLIERAPQVARRVAARRPFNDADALLHAIRDELLRLNEDERLHLFRSHPELAPDNPLSMTEESQAEQGRLSLTTAERDLKARLGTLNARYRVRFGFPFITALVRHEDMDSVLTEFETRLAADRASEIEQALDQVATVSASRVAAMFGRGKLQEEKRAGVEG